MVRRGKTELRMAIRAWIVLEAADGENNADIAEHLGVALNTVIKCASGSSRKASPAWRSGDGRVDPGSFPPLEIVEIKELACELPATSGVPLSRWSSAELARELVARAVVAAISPSTVWRVLHSDAIRPWFHRMWIFPAPPISRHHPLRRLVEQVMTAEPYCSDQRVFWVVDNGSSHRARPRSTASRASGPPCG